MRLHANLMGHLVCDEEHGVQRFCFGEHQYSCRICGDEFVVVGSVTVEKDGIGFYPYCSDKCLDEAEASHDLFYEKALGMLKRRNEGLLP